MKVYQIVEKAPEFEAYFFPGGVDNVPDAIRFVYDKTGQQVTWSPAVEFSENHGQSERLYIHGRRGAVIERNILVPPRHWIVFEGPNKLRSVHEVDFEASYNIVKETNADA